MSFDRLIFQNYEIEKQFSIDRAFWLFCHRQTQYAYFDKDFPYRDYEKLYKEYYMGSPTQELALKKLAEEAQCRAQHIPTYAPNSQDKINGPDNTKLSNPKDAVGTAKSPASVIPRGVVQELGLAMLEGARKYGRHNYRNAGVRASVYFDAANRHLDAWWEGEDIDPDSGLSHIIKCIASLTVLRDSMMHANWTDDRPPKMSNRAWLAELNEKAKAVIEKYPSPKEAFIEKNKND